MPEELLVFPLVVDLPEDWVVDSIITPNGTEVGLTERYGYNYLMRAVNENRRAANFLNTKIATMDAIPKGIVAMWAGELINIPVGWKLCDGQEGRPNMLARFIRGISNNTANPGTTGGQDAITLSETHLPSHEHSIGSHTHSISAHAHGMTHSHSISGTLSNSDSHVHHFSRTVASVSLGTMIEDSNVAYDYPGTWFDSYPHISKDGTWAGIQGSEPSGGHTHTLSGSSASYSGNTGTSGEGTTGGATGTTGQTGDGQSLDIRPAYYEIAFIIKA